MPGVGELRLVFRLGGVGFALPISQLLEIVEEEAHPSPLDHTRTDDGQEYCFRRGEAVSLYDLGRWLELPNQQDRPAVVLILAGLDGPWGIRVDMVAGIHPADDFLVRTVPDWVVRRDRWPSLQLLIWHEELLVQIDPRELEMRWRAA